MPRKLTQAELAKKMMDELSERGYQAQAARGRLEKELNKWQSRPDWKELAELAGVYEHSNAGDWMC